MQIGGDSAFALMVPVLAGFIAFSIADRPGLTPGLIGGMLAVSTGRASLVVSLPVSWRVMWRKPSALNCICHKVWKRLNLF